MRETRPMGLTARWSIGLGPILLACLLGASPRQGATRETVGILPLQDLEGNPGAAQRIDRDLRDVIGRTHALADAEQIRTALRRLRIRDPNGISPELLNRLALDLGVEWFLSVSLIHAASRPVPQVTVSAWGYRVDGPDLDWAALESSSGLDERGVLERGRTDDLEILAHFVVERLVARFVDAAAGIDRYGPDARPSTTGFLSGPVPVDGVSRVAVIPFDAVTDDDPVRASSAITHTALAVLNRRGVRLVFPGLVSEILRQGGVRRMGGVDADTRAALRSKGGADLILTGTVETYEVRPGALEPEPRVAFSARLIDADTGRILWIDGQERDGWDDEGLFRTGRIYADGVLAELMMESMISGFLGMPRSRAAERER